MEVTDRMCCWGEVVDIVYVVFGMLVYIAGRFCKVYVPESIFILAPLENGRSFASDGDVIMVMDCGSFITFVKNGNMAIVSKCSDAE